LLTTQVALSPIQFWVPIGSNSKKNHVLKVKGIATTKKKKYSNVFHKVDGIRRNYIHALSLRVDIFLILMLMLPSKIY
jgi:hypothetical protein